MNYFKESQTNAELKMLIKLPELNLVHLRPLPPLKIASQVPTNNFH